MKKILLTGAAGFIGWRTAQALLDQGLEVVGVDNLNDYYDVRLKDYRLGTLKGQKGFTSYQLDIENLGALEVLFQDHRFDAVINLAARAGVRYSLVDPHVYVRTNTQGTTNLLELMQRHGVTKMVLASTSSLYAGNEVPFHEDQPISKPLSPYASSKRAAELMAYTYHYIYGLDISVMRYFTVYGPAGRPDMSILRFIRWVDHGEPLQVFGDATQSRDFTYVDDIARGTVMALKPVGYEVINLGGGKEPVTLKGLIERIEGLLGKKATLVHHPFNKADMSETMARVDKAQRLLGWQPEVGLDEGLELTVKWYREQYEWVKDIKL